MCVSGSCGMHALVLAPEGVRAEPRREQSSRRSGASLPGPLSRTHGLPSDVGSHEKNVRERETSEDASPEPRGASKEPIASHA
eukprot:tig00000912_g5455.t1